jgi:hypothetical protein
MRKWRLLQRRMCQWRLLQRWQVQFERRLLLRHWLWCSQRRLR